MIKKYFFWYCYQIIGRARYIIRSRKMETQRAYAFLKETERIFNGRFNLATKRKIATSYGIYNPMICDAFTCLHGRITNIEERKRFIHYFICSSLFDDFSDSLSFSDAKIRSIAFQADKYDANSFDERVFLNSKKILFDFVVDKDSYQQITFKLLDAQIQSGKQYKSALDDASIQQITFKKGGFAVLLCHYYLDLPACNTEAKCWYQIGVLIQLTNDLFDIYKDIQDHIETLPSRMTDVYQFERFFKEQITEMNRLISGLPYSYQIKQKFGLSMAGIYSFGLIAIQQLKNIQGNADKLPELCALPRKSLIVNMENFNNLIKWFKFTYRHSKLVVEHETNGSTQVEEVNYAH